MRRICIALLATTGFVALASAASAADIAPAYKAPPPAPRPPCATFRGFYVGGNVGWAFHDKRWVDRDAWVDNFNTDWAIGSTNQTTGGVTGGVQAGYNWQRSCTVFGIETDFNWANLKDTRIYSPADAAGSTTLTLRDDLKWYGTVRTRTGVIVDDLLLYVTGGFAYARINHDFTVTDAGTVPAAESFSAKSSRYGWTGGFGVEWAFANNWSLKSEVLYLRFNDVLTTGFSPNGPDRVRFDNIDSMWVTRVGINWRFGGGY